MTVRELNESAARQLLWAELLPGKPKIAASARILIAALAASLGRSKPGNRALVGKASSEEIQYTIREPHIESRIVNGVARSSKSI